jgi:hypothetical protein
MERIFKSQDTDELVFREDPKKAPVPTHILKIFKSQNSEMLFRADDGICIGQRKNETVIFGEEPNKRSSHVFIDGAKAGAWLEAYAQTDLRNRKVMVTVPAVTVKAGTVSPSEDTIDIPAAAVIDRQDAESIIQLAPGCIDLPKYGANPLRN